MGFGNGTVKGGSPKARVATDKVWWPPISSGGGCYGADIMESIDMAIHDGVDVISISVGGDNGESYWEDSIAVGAFHAMKKGFVVVASAGNFGPTPGSVINVAPWIINVAATTLDRKLQAIVELMDGLRLKVRICGNRICGRLNLQPHFIYNFQISLFRQSNCIICTHLINILYTFLFLY